MFEAKTYSLVVFNQYLGLASLLVSQLQIELFERLDGFKQVYVSLSTNPAFPVFVSIYSNAGDRLIVYPTTFLFDSSNWMQINVLNLTVVDDLVAALPGNFEIELVCTSDDLLYDGLNRTIQVTVYDADEPGMVVNFGNPIVFMNEWNITFKQIPLQLLSKPQVPITVRIEHDFDSRLHIAPLEFEFTSENWELLFVNVSVFDDFLIQPIINITLRFIVSSADVLYDGISSSPSQITIFISSNDMAGVDIRFGSHFVTELHNETLLARAIVFAKLQAQPLSNITLSFVTIPHTISRPSLRYITFHPTSWNVLQKIEVVVNSTQTPLEPNRNVSFIAIVSSGDAEFLELDAYQISIPLFCGIGYQYSTENGSCVECPAGTVKSDLGWQDCTACDIGFVGTVDQICERELQEGVVIIQGVDDNVEIVEGTAGHEIRIVLDGLPIDSVSVRLESNESRILIIPEEITFTPSKTL